MDLRAGKLHKHGIRIALQNQPFEVLRLLIERQGGVVTREEIRSEIWPGNTVADSDAALSTAVQKIRTALSDSADKPRYVETLPKRGYRFVSAVEELADAVIEAPPQAPPARDSPPKPRRYVWAAALATGLLAVGLLAARWVTAPQPAPKVVRYTQLTNNGRPKVGILATDGVRLYFTEGSAIVEVSVTGGTTVPIASGWNLAGISPAGDRLLVADGAWSTAPDPPLAALPLPAGAPVRLGVSASAAAWSPDGKELLYGKGQNLFVADKDGHGSRQLATLPGPASQVTWSPDGSEIGITLNVNGNAALWRMPASRERMRAVPDNLFQHDQFGIWMPDGRYNVFQRGGPVGDLWARRESRGLFGPGKPVPLTDGPLRFSGGIL